MIGSSQQRVPRGISSSWPAWRKPSRPASTVRDRRLNA